MTLFPPPARPACGPFVRRPGQLGAGGGPEDAAGYQGTAALGIPATALPRLSAITALSCPRPRRGIIRALALISHRRINKFMFLRGGVFWRREVGGERVGESQQTLARIYWLVHLAFWLIVNYLYEMGRLARARRRECGGEREGASPLLPQIACPAVCASPGS